MSELYPQHCPECGGDDKRRRRIADELMVCDCGQMLASALVGIEIDRLERAMADRTGDARHARAWFDDLRCQLGLEISS